ncbi:hypothetical protein RR46_01751 [Papilio xuthus]|uniref:Uncharacterized protein n=1 Tax=Papilio xuthus TaxID=66420 RepID=A0A194QFX0_PAPXU|nr:hypothetical protein RR46_01751 [Papilio xuthus]
MAKIQMKVQSTYQVRLLRILCKRTPAAAPGVAAGIVYKVDTLNWEIGLFGEDRIGIVIGVTSRISKFRVSQHASGRRPRVEVESRAASREHFDRLQEERLRASRGAPAPGGGYTSKYINNIKLSRTDPRGVRLARTHRTPRTHRTLRTHRPPAAIYAVPFTSASPFGLASGERRLPDRLSPSPPAPAPAPPPAPPAAPPPAPPAAPLTPFFQPPPPPPVTLPRRLL